jgi:hypothetical protein
MMRSSLFTVVLLLKKKKKKKKKKKERREDHQTFVHKFHLIIAIDYGRNSREPPRTEKQKEELYEKRIFGRSVLSHEYCNTQLANYYSQMNSRTEKSQEKKRQEEKCVECDEIRLTDLT